VKAGQRAIFYVQRELETAGDADNPAIVLCDRGTIDGAAYWPAEVELWASVGTTLEEQLHRYDAVIHLRTPPAAEGYNHKNALRLESAVEAAEIDARIIRAWDKHPRRVIVDPSPDFLDKAARVLDILRVELPECCRQHVIPVLAGRHAH
jgi:hypothetical protein